MAIRRSINTVAVKMAEKMSPRTVFDFLHDDLHMDSLIERTVSSDGEVYSDISIAPMALGGLTEGVTPLEMAGAYQIFGNGGNYTEPYLYTEVRDSEGRVILKADTQPRRVLSPDTADIMNKLLFNVCNATSGTGSTARVPNMPTAGKTGTSNDDVDQWFIGYTPYYVCQVWIGYDEPWTHDSAGNWVQNRVDYYTGGHQYPPPVLFNSIMAPLHEGLEYKNFEESGLLVSKLYCTATGKLAAEGCPTASGWYKDKPTGMPQVCNGRHMTAEEQAAAESGEVDPDDPNAGYSGQGAPPGAQPAVPVNGDGEIEENTADPNAGYSGQGPPV
jgi:penicillin-binding protein 1A